ncbi:hypothetical protein [Bacteroides timonensis]|uniref:hypothetical protein n=1 Tax=Bacteroides timonensis TaxID=1470345 RepID=UPI001FCC877C|nr:hypothetical protein [Bacteroides timonensis]
MDSMLFYMQLAEGFFIRGGHKAQVNRYIASVYSARGESDEAIKFSVRLLEAFPGLSMKDVYFCCLVKINVSIKDLSDIYCISRTSINQGSSLAMWDLWDKVPVSIS